MPHGSLLVRMLSSLRVKILLALTLLVLSSTLSIMFLVGRETVRQISVLQNDNAQHLVDTVALNVENQYKNLVHYKQTMVVRKKQELNNIIHLALISIREQYQKYLDGEIGEEEAKRAAIKAVGAMRYSDDVGYVWINDTGRPIPRMIMHPTIPELDGLVLDDPAFNCAQGLKKNLFVAAVDEALAAGEGYVDYLWPKPTRDGLTEERAKLSFVKLFKEWNWVVGTGIYIDDIEEGVQQHLQSIVADLRDTFSRVRVGESGYMYLFTGKKEMLIHPSLVGADFSRLINPTTGKPILDDLVVAAKTSPGLLEYLWDKPPEHKGEFRFWKKSHIVYFEPLDWYIASSVYTDEIEAPARAISRYILLLTGGIFLITFAVSLLLARSLTQPLHLLTAAAQKIDYDGLADAAIPVTGTVEVRRLGTILNKMLGSIRQAVKSKEELFASKLALEARLHKAEKLESVGRLAAGLAHEINTPVQYVSANIDFLQDAAREITGLVEEIRKRLAAPHDGGSGNEKLQDTVEADLETADWEFLREEIPRALDQSQEGLKHIARIVMAMKTFARPGSGKREPVDINAAIENTVTVAGNEWRNTAEMELQLAAGLPHVPGYADELNQVLLNMIVNSAQAIVAHRGEEGPEDGKGRIFIATQKVGDRVQIRLSDTGGGMPREVVEKIFDPFYTTKEVGRGSGQGLAIAHDVIVNKHAGTIEVETEPGKGTTFVISLPVDAPVEGEL